MRGNKKLSEKASQLDFSTLPTLMPLASRQVATNPVSGDGHRPKTAPGAMMAFAVDARSELVRENERLKSAAEDAALLQGKVSELASELAQWDGVKATRLIDPKRIKRSKWANRHDHSYSDMEFMALKDELLSAGGNIQPIKIRHIGKDAEGDCYEIVFGHRRHQACLDLGLPVLSTIENVSDQGLFVEMDRENRSRKNLSPWEQGMMYLRALNEGLFPSQKKLAEAVGIDLSALGKALNLARLPLDVVSAFPSPLDMQFRWAKPLTDALTHDEQGVLARAKSVSEKKEKPSARSIFEYLINGYLIDEQGEAQKTSSKKTVLRLAGKQVGILDVLPDGAVTIQFQSGKLSTERVAILTALINDFLSSKDTC